MQLTVIIPLYNEEALITELLRRLLAVPMPPAVEALEILIVDDCSRDRSFAVVEAFIAPYPHIRLMRHDVNQGKGAAVKTGFRHAAGDVVLIQDADLELSPEDIPRMVNCMTELGVEFVNGSRYLPGVNRPLSSYRRYFFNYLFTLLTSILINVRLTDMACGYKLVSRRLFEQIIFRENRFGFEAELIIKATRLRKNNIAEVPVCYTPRNYGEGKKLRNSDGLKILWKIIRYGLLRLD